MKLHQLVADISWQLKNALVWNVCPFELILQTSQLAQRPALAMHDISVSAK